MAIEKKHPIGGGAGGGAENAFKNIQTDLGTSPVADSATDTLSLTSVDHDITGNATNDTVTWAIKQTHKYFNVMEYGAVGDGTTDDTAAFNSANTAAAAVGGTVYIPPDTYYIASTVTFTTHVIGHQAQLNTDQNITAIQVGDGTNLIQKKTLQLPIVRNTAKPSLGWSGTSIGVKVTGAYSCRITFNEIRGFVTGAHITAPAAKGCVYNDFHLGLFHDNQTQLLLFPDTAATAWVNENNFLGGRFLYNTAELQAPSTSLLGQSGCRNIYIKTFASDTAQLCNNNIFDKPSLEGNVPEAHIECQGFANVFNFARYEAEYPKVKFTSYSAARPAQANVVYYGAYSNLIVASEDANAAYNSVLTNGVRRESAYGAGATGVWHLQNPSSAGSPIFVLFRPQAAGAFFNVNPATDYQFNWSANEILAKKDTDQQHRIKLDAFNGRLNFGPGTNANPANVYLDSADGNTLRVTGQLAVNSSLVPTHSSIYSDAFKRLQGVALGASGTVLTSNGTAAAPSYQTISYPSQVSDTAYDSTSWNGVAATAPSQNAVRDQIETMLTSIAAKKATADFANSRTSADVTTTVITAANANGLNFSIGASEIWTAEFNLFIGCNNTGGVKFAITVPTSATFKALCTGSNASPSGFTTSQIGTSGALTATAFMTANSAFGWARIAVTVVNSTNAGTVQLQFASGVATQTSTVYANSYLTARKV